MDIAIVAPCPIPYMIGGAENLWRGSSDHLNEHTPHQAEIIKLPSRSSSFWELIDSYRRSPSSTSRASTSSSRPSTRRGWSATRSHVVYMLHRLRGLYDTYDVMNLPRTTRTRRRRCWSCGLSWPSTPGAARRCPSSSRAWRRCATRRASARTCSRSPARSSASSCTGSTASASRRRRSGATARSRRRSASAPGYFPPGADVFVAHPPTGLEGRRGGARALPVHGQPARRAEADRPADRGDGGTSSASVELRIAGTGPEEARLRELAAGDARIAFAGASADAELAELYAGARAVAFIPQLEDFGLVTLEAMLAGKPVITCTRLRRRPRSWSPTASPGWSSSRSAEALAAAIDRAVGEPPRGAPDGPGGARAGAPR